MVYGKTVHSMSDDIYKNFSTLLVKGECKILANIIYKFYQERFSGIVNLMDLVRNVGWLSAAMKKPVFYSIPIFTTVQDYMKSKAVNIWLYDRINKKRRQVTLRIPTLDRDRKKTTAATFANFIHQKDAYIAMFMILEMLLLGAPIYTVHENFITTAPYAMNISDTYIKTFTNGLEPLYYINFYILRNLLDGNVPLRPINEPLPFDELQKYLEECIPNN